MVQWLSSDIYIFEHVFFLRGGVRIPEIFFSLFFSYSFSGQFELPSPVTNSGGSRRGSGVNKELSSHKRISSYSAKYWLNQGNVLIRRKNYWLGRKRGLQFGSAQSIFCLFLFLSQNICCGYSKEPSEWDGSFEYSKHMLKLTDKKKIVILRSNILLICTDEI